MGITSRVNTPNSYIPPYPKLPSLNDMPGLLLSLLTTRYSLLDDASDATPPGKPPSHRCS